MAIKILKRLGLENPRIEFMKVTHKTTGESRFEPRLLCDNYAKSKSLAKKHSFFEQYLNVFLLAEVMNLLEKIKTMVVNEGLDDTLVCNASSLLFEDAFSEYLTETKGIWEDELAQRMEIPFDFKWKLAPSVTMLQVTQTDLDNGMMLLCLIPEESRNIIKKENKVIEAKIISSLFKERSYSITPCVYYKYIDDVEIARSSLAERVKAHLNSNEVAVFIVPCGDNHQNIKKTVYLFKSLSFGGAKEDN